MGTAGYYGKREAEAEPEADAEALYSTYGYNNYGYSGLGYSTIARPAVYSAGYSTVAPPLSPATPPGPLSPATLPGPSSPATLLGPSSPPDTEDTASTDSASTRDILASRYQQAQKLNRNSDHFPIQFVSNKN